VGICVEDHQTTTQGGYPSISSVARIKVLSAKDLRVILAPFGSDPNGARITDTIGFHGLAPM
jgi:hypothetical protein